METRIVVITENQLKSILLDVFLELEKRKSLDALEMSKNEKLYSINQVARRLGRAHNTIKKLISQGLLRTTPDGMISEKSINDYLSNN